MMKGEEISPSDSSLNRTPTNSPFTCTSTESCCLGRSTMVIVSRRNRLRRYFSRRQISLRVTDISSLLDGLKSHGRPPASSKSAGVVRQFLDEMVHLLRGVFAAIAIDQLGGHAHRGAALGH